MTGMNTPAEKSKKVMRKRRKETSCLMLVSRTSTESPLFDHVTVKYIERDLKMCSSNDINF